LVTFNVILLFTKILSRFNIITKLKPLLDAYQGPYKIKFYYWVGLQLMIRTIIFGLSSLDSNINLTIGIIILSMTNVAYACSKPFKNSIKNYQEIFMVVNLVGLYTFTLSFAQNNDVNTTAISVLIIMAVVQFTSVVFYHIFTYTCSEVIQAKLILILHIPYDVLAGWISRLYTKLQPHNQQLELQHCNIPEVTYNYHEYQEPLIGLEYHK